MRNTLDGRQLTGGIIDQLIRRSRELEDELSVFMELRPAWSAARIASSVFMLGVAFEHGCSVRLLIEQGNLTSAFGLARLQYEALVRGVWLIQAASDEQVENIHRDLTQESIERLPMVVEMLKSLPGNAQPGVLANLLDFQSKSLKPLNSFVHSGAHALQRSVVGYPAQLVRQVLVASNGLKAISAFEVISLAQDAGGAVTFHGLQTTYSDCLPGYAV